MTIDQLAGQVLAVVKRARSQFPPMSQPAQQLSTAEVRIRAIAQTATTASTPAAERMIVHELRSEMRKADALMRE